MPSKIPRWLLVLSALSLLVSCNMAVFEPKGLVASEQKDLILISLGLMLIVVVPVLVLTLVFAFKYRASNTKAKYTPDWDHNNLLEAVWWGIPIVIIGILGVITWRSSHDLDPYKPLESSVKPIEVQVVALEWKWLFIYPEQGIASLNFMQVPAHVPVNFKITAQAPMNSFWIPQLAGQIYAMEGMQTLLHVIADEPGDYFGMSANFSGEGFNGMKFIARASSPEAFSHWVDSVKATGDTLTRARYDALVKPSSDDAPRVFAASQPGLFMDIMMQFMPPMDSMAGMPENCPMRHRHPVDTTHSTATP